MRILQRNRKIQADVFFSYSPENPHIVRRIWTFSICGRNFMLIMRVEER
eukprot:UN02137